MKMLSDAEYVAAGGNQCPHCRSTKLKADRPTVEGVEAYQDVECLDCKRTWVEVFRLIGWSCG